MARKKIKTKEGPAEENAAPANFTYQNSNRARGLMWLGVITVSSVIAVLWGWNIKLQISSLSFKKTLEQQMISNAQSDWNQIFENNKLEAEKRKNISQIKNILQEITSATDIAIYATPTPITDASTTAINISTTTNE